MIKKASQRMPNARKTLNLVTKLLYFSIEIHPKLQKVIQRFGDRYDELWDRKNAHPTKKIKLFPMKQVSRPENEFWDLMFQKRVFRSWRLFHWKELDFLRRMDIFPIPCLVVTISKTLNYFLQPWVNFDAKLKQFGAQIC